jgi:hypothetical protein
MLTRLLTGVCVVAVGAVAASPEVRTQLIHLGEAPATMMSENEKTVVYMADPAAGAKDAAAEEMDAVQARWEENLVIARSVPAPAPARKQASKPKKTVSSYFRAASAKKAPKQLGRPKYANRYGRSGQYNSSLSNRFGLLGARKSIFENSRFFQASGRNPNAMHRSPHTRRSVFQGVPRYGAKSLNRAPKNIRRTRTNA